MVQGIKENCDVCDSNLFNFHWSCGRCGFVVCIECFSDDSKQSSSADQARASVVGLGIQHGPQDEVEGRHRVEEWMTCVDKGPHDVDRLMLTQIITANTLQEVTSKLAEAAKKVKSKPTSLRDLIGSSSSLNQGPRPETKHRALWMEDSQDDLPELFREEWKRGVPVLVGNAAGRMDLALWSPANLNDEFGDVRAEYVDAATGASLGVHPLKKFFDGFAVVSRRNLISTHCWEGPWTSAVRLKNWPPQSGEDFANLLPEQTADLLQALPLPEYTSRDGPLNLASSLPDVFSRPDLGPRALLSYGGSPWFGQGGASANPAGVTFEAKVNLHFAFCDTVSILVHAEAPRDLDPDFYRHQVLKVMEESGCGKETDDRTWQRMTLAKEMPGILWHVFNPGDAGKVREFLSRASKSCHHRPPLKKLLLLKKGRQPHPEPGPNGDDPLGDESSYLDQDALSALRKEHGVEPYVIAQFPGEALLLPAGAPRQVPVVVVVRLGQVRS